jgi:hypothetical protein
MRKIAIALCLLFLLTACNTMSETKASEPLFEISSLSVGFGGNEDGTVQYVRYSMILTYGDELTIDDETVEPLVAGWIEERMLDHVIETAQGIGKGQFKLEGKVTFDAKDLTKREIINLEKQEETIQGVVFETKNGRSYQAVIVESGTKLKKIGR